MVYSEIYCQICGVSFAIARIRTPLEPVEAAWTYTGYGFVDQEVCGDIEDTCSKSSGCQTLERRGRWGGDEMATEHLAGPGCISGLGYTGYQISVEEMKGCRAVQCLMKKGKQWKAEKDDQKFELESNYFLTGHGGGSPDVSPLTSIEPARHGVGDVLVCNFNLGIDNNDWGVPFHPTCFEIFKKISIARTGRVDVHGLWEWRRLAPYEEFFKEFPREFAVRNGRDQWWNHDPGSEYLAANPVEVPNLVSLLNTCHRESIWNGPGKDTTFNVNTGVFNWKYKRDDEHFEQLYKTPPRPSSLTADPFMKLPTELLYKIVDDLSSKDVARMRLVTRAYRQLPIIMFRKFLLEDMPWLWEVQDIPQGQEDWFKMYNMVKGCWQNIKSLRNRKRVWKDVHEIMNRLEKLRRDGKIVD